MISRDMIVITVRNDNQKSLCEKLISRLNSDRLKNITFVPDCCPENKGSGAAFLNIIKNFYQPGKKILLINSGGMCRRSVNYSICGKLFTNIIYKDKKTSLLEAILDSTSVIFEKITSGVLVCCSDVLLEIRDENFGFCFSENIGFAVKEPSVTGASHGVMICDDNGRLIRFLHKESADTLKTFSDDSDRVPVDTGMIYFCDEFCMNFKSVSDGIINSFGSSKELNLYSDIVSRLGATAENRKMTPAEHSLFKSGMKICTLESTEFFHYGTNRETLKNIVDTHPDGNYISFCSSIDGNGTVAKNSILDYVQISGCKVGSGCIVSNIILNNVRIPDNVSVCGIKLTDGKYVAIVTPIDDSIDFDELWKKQLFFRGFSFTDSFTKYIENVEAEKLSIEYCIDNADYSYAFELIQYLSDKAEGDFDAEYKKIRKSIIDNYFSKKPIADRLTFKTDRAETFLPLRVNLSGSWTDAVPYCIDNGGQVINMAISVEDKLPVYVYAERTEDSLIRFVSDGQKFDFFFEDDDDPMSDFTLHRAVLQTLGINRKTGFNGGFVLSTNVSGVEKGSGLGTSSILLAGCFFVLGRLFGLNFSKSDIIDKVFIAEQIMGTGGGWQDQMGALYPAVKIGTSCSGIVQNVKVEPVAMPNVFAERLSDRLIIVPTGKRHFGRFIVGDVSTRYLLGKSEVINAFTDIEQLNNPMKYAFECGSISLLCENLNRHYELLKLISPRVSDEYIEELRDFCLEYSEAVSICGAGGGGYLVAVLKENTSLSALRQVFTERFPEIRSPIKKISICQQELI